MEISRSILNPYLSQMRSEFEVLNREISLRGESERLLPLSHLTHRKIHQIEDLFAFVNGSHPEANDPALEKVHKNYRKLKLDLRFAKRKWQRLLSNEARFLKRQGRENHVTTFAA